MSTRTLAVVSAGLGTPSSTRLLADRLAAATSEAVRERGDEVHVEVVELREHAHDLASMLLTGFAPPALSAAIDSVTHADAVIAVTPVFTASYSGLFKTFLDVLDPKALVGTPVLIGATAGTPRHSLVLEHAVRPIFAYLRAVVVPTAVFAAAEDWGAGDGELTDRVARAAGELADLVTGTPARRRADPADPFADTPSFDALLRR
ncbi:FMN reductase [Actinomycetospora sp. TBRC 11914]|uniref:FMN reductase n=1 Tax=Actinomycetospora sp. TBRC 11914 TaxID=2729387 RepID=UPI00145E0B28|nr:FMN reductase [Actinomycetospora sp. TBRC 11914]NMO93737.1 FMN reductase [Actinomycetospora sp. TBRC 11914]